MTAPLVTFTVTERRTYVVPPAIAELIRQAIADGDDAYRDEVLGDADGHGYVDQVETLNIEEGQ